MLHRALMSRGAPEIPRAFLTCPAVALHVPRPVYPPRRPLNFTSSLLDAFVASAKSCVGLLHDFLTTSHWRYQLPRVNRAVWSPPGSVQHPIPNLHPPPLAKVHLHFSTRSCHFSWTGCCLFFFLLSFRISARIRSCLVSSASIAGFHRESGISAAASK